MALTFRALATGNVPVAKTILYTCPPGQVAFIRSISYVNVSGGPITVNLYANRVGGLARRLWPPNMPLPTGWRAVEDDAVTLIQGDTIEGDASGNTDFIINGGEAPISDTLQT